MSKTHSVSRKGRVFEANVTDKLLVKGLLKRKVVNKFCTRNRGVFLGALALVLMFPANIVANLVTPKLKNWWAKRSVASTRERIETLKKQLADYEQHPELSELKDCALKALEGVGILGFLCVQLLAITLLMDAALLSPVVRYNPLIVPPGITAGLSILALVSVVFGFLVHFLVFNKLAEFRKKQSPFDRASLRAWIKKLEEKLAQM